VRRQEAAIFKISIVGIFSGNLVIVNSDTFFDSIVYNAEGLAEAWVFEKL
jgi:hypothetical protein